MPEQNEDGSAAPEEPQAADFARQVMTLVGVVAGAILFLVVVGEWLGLLDKVTENLPWYIGLPLILLAGWPVFRNVLRATLNKQIIAHTLMTIGVLAAVLVGQWATAAVVVFFMRVGDYTEKFTAEKARRAVKDLTALSPQTARVERAGEEVEVPIKEVVLGEVVVVRPGEMIPVDGEVLSGQAMIDQAAITGESVPVDVAAGSSVYAVTIAEQGALRIQTTALGEDTTFGRVVRLVEEAEANKADVQRLADRFAGYFLPLVLSDCRVDLPPAPRPDLGGGGAGGGLFVFLCPGDADRHAGLDRGGGQTRPAGEGRQGAGSAGEGGCAAGGQDRHAHPGRAADRGGAARKRFLGGGCAASGGQRRALLRACVWGSDSQGGQRAGDQPGPAGGLPRRGR